MSSASGSRQGYAGSAFSNIVGALPSKVSTGYGWKQESTSLTSSTFTTQASEFSSRYGGGHKHVSLPSSIVSTGASKFSTEYGGRQDHTRLAASYSIVKVEPSEFSRALYGGREENAGLPTSIVGAQASKFSREYGGRQDNAGLTSSMARVALPSGHRKSENGDDQHGKGRLTSSSATQLASHSHVNVASSARIDYDLPSNTRPDQNESAISVMEDFFYNIGFSGYS